MAGRRKERLQVVDRFARARVGEGEVQVAALPDQCLTLQLDLDIIDHRGSGTGLERDRLRSGTSDSNDLSLVHVVHLAALPELGVYFVRAPGREDSRDGQLTEHGERALHLGSEQQLAALGRMGLTEEVGAEADPDAGLTGESDRATAGSLHLVELGEAASGKPR